MGSFGIQSNAVLVDTAVYAFGKEGLGARLGLSVAF
jgi:hypothetical protein